MRKVKILTPEEAALLIKDGDTVRKLRLPGDAVQGG